MKIKLLIFSLCLLSALGGYSQTKIKDGTASGGSLPNANALLELESTNKGFLLPRIALTATDAFAPLSAHVAGMTVYNTATSGSGTTAVVPGYYYNDGTQWVKLGGAVTYKEPWNIQGTTTPAETNTQNIYQMGSVAIGTNVANSTLQLNGSVATPIRTVDCTGATNSSPLNVSLTDTDYTVILNGVVVNENSVVVTFPDAATCKGRIYVLANNTATSNESFFIVGQTISSYSSSAMQLKVRMGTVSAVAVQANALKGNVIAGDNPEISNNRVTWQSDGDKWYIISL